MNVEDRDRASGEKKRERRSASRGDHLEAEVDKEGQVAQLDDENEAARRSIGDEGEPEPVGRVQTATQFPKFGLRTMGLLDQNHIVELGKVQQRAKFRSRHLAGTVYLGAQDSLRIP